MASRLDLEHGRYDQSTYEGRARHFFATLNPLNVLASDADLDKAKQLVEDYRAGREDPSLTEDEIWKTKELYDSAFHVQTGEKLFLPGRMSFQVPGNMFITGCMLTFYKTTPAVIFWQAANQGFNALANYTNRNASVEMSTNQLAVAGSSATVAGVSTALIFNKIIAKNPALKAGMVGRFVPLIAVAIANCVNIPLMRNKELTDGIHIATKDGTEVGASTQAGMTAISQVIPSRIAMAAPSMAIPPLAMSQLERSALFVSNPWLKAPATVFLTGLCLTFSTPLCCALFPQKSAIRVEDLEPELQAKVRASHPEHSVFYYNKGL